MASPIKNIALLVLISLVASILSAQPPTNHIKETTMKDSVSNLEQITTANSLQSISYFDGLGRPIQSISMSASPLGNDMVQNMEYDGFGREAIKTMPYAIAGDGNYRQQADPEYKAFYKGLFPAMDTSQLKSVTLFEESPLNRPLKQGAPGQDWQIGQGHETVIAYSTNTTAVKKWKVTGTTTNKNSFAADANYPAGTLFVNTLTDENQHQTCEYKNLDGQVVLTEAYEGTAWLQTYYVYNDLGQLACVIPPAAKAALNDNYCFYYRYDGRKRMIMKKIPGADVVYMAYDKRDRVALSQDGNMRSKKKWMATKYDAFNRPNLTGLYTSTRSLSALQTSINADMDYVKANAIDTLSQTFYDNYNGLVGHNFVPGYQPACNTAVKGQITYTRTRYNDGSPKWLITVNYYDDKYRVIQTIADNHMGGKDIMSSQYDFTGKVTATTQIHTVGSETTTITKQFVYDRTGRLLETSMQVNAGETKTISKNNYNELGQLVKKETHKNADNSYLYKTAMQYNIRGWMTGMSDTSKNSQILFSLQLGYNTGANAQYNGNISSMKWNSIKLVSPRKYNFTYDHANRLKTAVYTGTTGENYNTSYTYDYNGNITKLLRSGLKTGNSYANIDNLTYTYLGNRLIGLNDLNNTTNQEYGYSDKGTFKTVASGTVSTHEYRYDTNGNMVLDYNKQIDTIVYDHLNLLTLVDLGDNNYIEYLYDAAGIKLQQKIYNQGNPQKQMDCVGNFIYEKENLAFIVTDEGRLVKNGTGFDYEYYLKDHLGNTRVTVKDSLGFAAVQQENHYDPFGYALAGQSYQNPQQQVANKYLYNGKELQDDEFPNGNSLDWYDYGARFYDATLGRWWAIDPLAEKYFEMSPYNYVRGNPILRIDPDGLTDYTLNRKTGEVAQVGEANDDPDRILKTNRKGEVKYRKNGDAKVAINDIGKGILKDGMNFKTSDNTIEVCGLGQASVEKIEDFAVKLSAYVGTEIGGAYFSKDGAAETSLMTIGRYKNN